VPLELLVFHPVLDGTFLAGRFARRRRCFWLVSNWGNPEQ
jgi:hypothetical protein